MLVILAILAAILVPALLGYIDEAKKKQAVLDAKNILTATQSKLNQIYAKRSSEDSGKTNVLRSGNYEKYAAGQFIRYGFSYEVFQLAGYNLIGSKPDNWHTQYVNDKLPKDSDIWNTAESEPYFVCVGLGDYETYAKSASDIHKAYTVYFMIYQAN